MNWRPLSRSGSIGLSISGWPCLSYWKNKLACQIYESFSIFMRSVWRFDTTARISLHGSYWWEVRSFLADLWLCGFLLVWRRVLSRYFSRWVRLVVLTYGAKWSIWDAWRTKLVSVPFIWPRPRTSLSPPAIYWMPRYWSESATWSPACRDIAISLIAIKYIKRDNFGARSRFCVKSRKWFNEPQCRDIARTVASMKTINTIVKSKIEWV